MHGLKLLLFLLLTLSLASVAATESTAVTVCYNFGCKSKGYVKLTRADIKQLRGYFLNIKSARHEREQIASAIASMEQIVARSLPTRNDVGGNFKADMIETGQLDCIDESTNTTTYLSFFETKGWLKRHAVQDRVLRAPFLVDDHWTAVIREKKTGQLYAVDSWFEDNGNPPLIQKLEDWQNNKPPDISR
jgi:hypothetical protein